MLQLIKKKIYIVLNLELELGSFAVSSRSVLANCSGTHAPLKLPAQRQ